MKKSIFLFFAAILCATSASAWSYKTAANGWKASTSGFTWVTMNSGKSLDVVMLKDVGDGVNICQNDNGTGHTLYCKWTKTSGDIFRGTARWNNGLYSDETVVIPGGKVYIKVGSGTQIQMTADANYTYTADVTFSNTGQSYTISGGTVSGATINAENDMPSAGKPASLTMSNSYTSKNSGSVHIVFDLKTNKVTETAASEPEPVADVTIYFVNTKSWPSVNAYVWRGTDDYYKAWPGEAMTSTGDKAHGYDVYSYTFPETYTNCIFNGNGKTEDLTVNAGQYYDIASKKWYATLAEVPNPTPAVMETVYFINTGNWSKVNAYAWTSSNNGWPGAEMTPEAEQIAGFDVYSFTAEQGQWANLIFNNGEGTQTGNLTWQAGKYYAYSTGEWYADAATAEAALAAVVTYDYYITGSFNGNNPKKAENGMTLDGTVYKATVTLAAGDNTLKVTDGTWDKTWGYVELGAAYEEVSDAGEYNNIKITLAAEKEITVIFDATADKITFEGLTQIHTVTATVNPAEAGTITGLAADGKYNHGAEATLSAAAAEGYEFTCWTSGKDTVSTENPYTFTVTADVARVANFVAVDYKDITFTVGKSGFTGVPQIKWWGAKGLEDAAEPVEMTAGQYNRYSYTFSNIDAITGVSFYIVLDGVQSKTITLHETPNTYSQFYTILQEVFVTLEGETEGVQLEGHPSSDYTKVNGVVQLPANTTKAFKLTVDGKDKGGNTIALTKDNLTANFTEDGEGNATIATELAGGYLFTYDYITKDVTVVYPFVGTMDLGQMTPSYSDESVTLGDENNNEVIIYNVVEGEHTYGENFDIEASVKHNGEWYTLRGKGSWTLADGVMTLVATNLVDENNTVNYTITATALAPQEYTIACNGTYDEEVTPYYSSIKYVGTTNDTTVTIEIASYGGEPSVLGDINGTYFMIAEYVVEEGEDGVKVLTATATDEAGNTYHITITATKLVYPTVNIYGATATLDEEGTLTLSAEYKGKTVISEIWEYEGAGEYEWVGLVPTDYSFEWGANVVTVTEENGQYTITGVFLDYTDETKYNVTITTKATPTALDNLNTTVAPVKMIENGQLIIVKDGVQYNAQGAVVK